MGASRRLIGLIIDPDGSMDEMWPLIGEYPGFLGGVLFSAVLAIAARRRGCTSCRFHEWPLGGAGGLLVGTLPFVIGDASSQLPVVRSGGHRLDYRVERSLAAGSLAVRGGPSSEACPAKGWASPRSGLPAVTRMT